MVPILCLWHSTLQLEVKACSRYVSARFCSNDNETNDSVGLEELTFAKISNLVHESMASCILFFSVNLGSIKFVSLLNVESENEITGPDIYSKDLSRTILRFVKAFHSLVDVGAEESRGLLCHWHEAHLSHFTALSFSDSDKGKL